MTVENTILAVFRSRPNRFIAKVELDGNIVDVHVKNTGRLKELLYDGAKVCISEAKNKERKTKYDLVAVEKVTPYGKTLVSIDSQAANDVAHEWLMKGELFGKDAVIRREVTFCGSRFDFYIETADKRKIFLEVKGCTLEIDGTALFPDAPTQRGVKHLLKLCKCIDEGYEAYVLFVIQMKGVRCFRPNEKTHPEFKKALCRAKEYGVNVIALDCVVTRNSVTADSFVETIV